MQERPGTFPKRAFADNNIRRSTVFPAYPYAHPTLYPPNGPLKLKHFNPLRVVLHPRCHCIILTPSRVAHNKPTGYRDNIVQEWHHRHTCTLYTPCPNRTNRRVQNQVSSAVYRSSSVVPKYILAPQPFNACPLHNCNRYIPTIYKRNISLEIFRNGKLEEG